MQVQQLDEDAVAFPTNWHEEVKEFSRYGVLSVGRYLLNFPQIFLTIRPSRVVSSRN